MASTEISTLDSNNNTVLGVQIPYFGCGDPYGDNKPEENISELIRIFKKYKIKNKDIDFILKHIVKMCNTSYSNGYNSAEFDASESFDYED